MQFASYALAALAILVMGVNVVLAIRLRRSIVGGEVGEKWGMLTGLIVVFFVCYLASPLALYLEVSVQVLHALVFGVFLFGALFVWVVIGIIRDTLSFLKLVK